MGIGTGSPLPLLHEALARVERDYVDRLEASAVMKPTVQALAKEVGTEEPFSPDAVALACGERRTTIATTDAADETWIERLGDVREIIQPCLATGERSGRTEYERAVIRRMVGTLGRGSALFSPALAGELAGARLGVGGVGLELTRRERTIVVVAPIEGAPAARSGIRAGDRLVGIDGPLGADPDLVDTVKRLRGEVGTSVSLLVTRPGEWDAPREFVLVRERVTIPAPTLRWLAPRIGYLRVGRLADETVGHVRAALDGVRSREEAALILDLRQNSGGLFQVALRVAGLFLPAGSTLVVLEERRPGRAATDFAVEAVDGEDRRRRYALRAGGDGIPGRRVLVLVDHGTASGAEIVAGALRDGRRATLVGSRTLGNGEVSTLFPLSDLGMLRLVTARALTPGEQAIDERGIEPDVAVDGPPPEQIGMPSDAPLAWAVRAAGGP